MHTQGELKNEISALEARLANTGQNTGQLNTELVKVSSLAPSLLLISHFYIKRMVESIYISKQMSNSECMEIIKNQNNLSKIDEN